MSLGTTRGLRRADAKLVELISAAGAHVEIVTVGTGPFARLKRAQPVVDLVEAVESRRTAQAALRSMNPRAVVFSTVTAALLQPTTVRRNRKTAIRFDCTASMNRPGARNAVQRSLERRAFRAADLAIPTGEVAAQSVESSTKVVVPIPIGEIKTLDRVSGGDAPSRFVAYAADPKKRGLDLLCKAWAAVPPVGTLAVTGIEPERGRRFLARSGIGEPDGIEWTGMLDEAAFSRLLAGSDAFVNASRREDYGMSELEALAHGCLLVTVPSPGPFEALPIARRIGGELVADGCRSRELAAAIRTAGAYGRDALATYRTAARRELEPYRQDAVQTIVSERMLPALGIG